jgi:hypothetical protein
MCYTFLQLPAKRGAVGAFLFSFSEVQRWLLPLQCLPLQLWGCNGAANQRWWKDADGALRPIHTLQKCLSVAPGNIVPGAKLQVKADGR